MNIWIIIDGRRFAMKRTFFVFGFVFALFFFAKGQEIKEIDGLFYSGQKPFTGTSFSYFNNGSVKMESSYKNGMKDGQFKLNFENGKLNEIRSYKNNEMHGIWITWNERGIKIGEANYFEGKKHGKWFIWDENGHLVYEMNYQDGERSGTWRKFDPDGNLLSSRDF